MIMSSTVQGVPLGGIEKVSRYFNFEPKITKFHIHFSILPSEFREFFENFEPQRVFPNHTEKTNKSDVYKFILVVNNLKSF